MTKQENIILKSNKEETWKFVIRVTLLPFKLVIYGVIHLLVVLFWSRLWGKMASRGNSPKSKDDSNGGSNYGGENDAEIPEVITNVRRHHKLAYSYIAKALNIDETAANCDAKGKAVEWYRKGIEELSKGIEIVCDEEGQAGERARNLQTKMQDNLNSTIERMDELVALLSSQAGVSSNLTPSMTNSKDSNIPKNFKKPTSSGSDKPTSSGSDGPSAVGGKTSAVSRPKSSTPRPSATNVDRRKTEARSRMNRRPYSQPEAGRSTERKPSASLEDLKRDQKKKVSYLKNVDPKIASKILDEVVQNSTGVTFDDVAGMDNAKRILEEIVILPALRPELFTGLRVPARGLLLYGPPGNGKTMLAKAVSHQAKATFFNISAATLTSKWVGEGEKLVRALFAVARELQPSIIFIDEIDSLLCERKEGEMESSRRMKTEFLLAFDGLTSGEDEKILVMGATNRPQELDDAALRRLVKRVYLPLPDQQTRKILLEKLLTKHHSPLTDAELERLATLTENYSGSDLTALARDAALGPIREMRPDQLQTVRVDKVRNINFSDFVDSTKTVRASVSPATLKVFQDWTKTYGTQA